MFVNKNKKKKVTKLYKVLNIDIHGKLLKKKKLQNSFYLVYLFILKNLLTLNIKKKKIAIQSSKIKNFNEVLFLDFFKNKKSRLSFFNYFVKDKNMEKRMVKINLLLNKSSYMLSKEKEYLVFENRLKLNKNSKNPSVYFKTKFFKNKIFFNLYLSVTKKQYLIYIKKASIARHNVCSSFFNLIELRIDMVIYRSFSNLSLEKIKQMILHKKIYINNKIISYQSVILSKGDYVTFMNTNNFENYKTFADIYIYMLSQKINPSLFCFLFKYPKYILVDYNYLLINIVNNKFNCKEVPNFFEYNLKNFMKITF